MVARLEAAMRAAFEAKQVGRWGKGATRVLPSEHAVQRPKRMASAPLGSRASGVLVFRLPFWLLS